VPLDVPPAVEEPPVTAKESVIVAAVRRWICISGLAGCQGRPAPRGESDASTRRRGQRAARRQIREHVFPRTRGRRVFIEGLQPFPDDCARPPASRADRYRAPRRRWAGSAGQERTCSCDRLRLYHAVRNWTPCRGASGAVTLAGADRQVRRQANRPLRTVQTSNPSNTAAKTIRCSSAAVS
jgi:hypothetical protein